MTCFSGLSLFDKLSRPAECAACLWLHKKLSKNIINNLRLIFEILCHLFCKKGNAKKLYKGSKEFWKVFLVLFSTEKKNRHFLILYRFLLYKSFCLTFCKKRADFRATP
jgi:hypothetical protein